MWLSKVHLLITRSVFITKRRQRLALSTIIKSMNTGRYYYLLSDKERCRDEASVVKSMGFARQGEGEREKSRQSYLQIRIYG